MKRSYEAILGYSHPLYSESFSEIGTPMVLPKSGGQILIRQIPGSSLLDAMGCYPLFVCKDWSLLDEDLANSGKNLVSLSLVTDPFGSFSIAKLKETFTFVKKFKDHFVADLHHPPESFVTKHHRYYAKKALRELRVEACENPLGYLNEWIELYSNLRKKHRIMGFLGFSNEMFVKQLKVPGMIMLRVLYKGQPVGANLFYQHNNIAYSHLSAFSAEGYKMRAGYAVKWKALEFFSDKVRWLHLGAGSGTANSGNGGLTEFKNGWSSGTRPVYFCGRICNPEKYQEITKGRNITPTDYFPTYRQGEFK